MITLYTRMKHAVLVLLIALSFAQAASAQISGHLDVATVHRPPFVFVDGDNLKGFSIELMDAIGREIGKEIRFDPKSRFGDMFLDVQDETVDAAIANISITADRERDMDFSQPIFGSGIQIMLPRESGTLGLIGALFTQDIALLAIGGLGLLLVGGMLMWVFERRHQPYFDKPAREAVFPSFWWALNLVVNGGFEERMPRSVLGRMFAVLLVVASLFVVSVFVASITAAATVNAIRSNVESLRDLETRTIGTIAGSTSADFLREQSLQFAGYGTPAAMFNAFEDGEIDAVVFDGPILAYYVQTQSTGNARLIERVYRPENYGIVLPTGSALKEDIDQVLLRFRVDGTYDAILTKWFGNSYVPE